MKDEDKERIEDTVCKWCGRPRSSHYEGGIYCKPKPNFPRGEEHDSLTFEPSIK